MKYRVLICRKSDGEKRWSQWFDATADDERSANAVLFDWLENNNACDCNRHLRFTEADDDTEVDCGHTLYDVLRFETDDGRVADQLTGEWVAA